MAKRSIVLVSVSCLILVLSSWVPAQTFPEKPVTMIVNLPPGGLADLSARALAEHAKPFFPRPIIIVNRTGGTGTVGASEVIVAKPDGHTIGISPVAPMVVHPQRVDLPYRTLDDYQPIIKIVKGVLVLAVHSGTPWKTMNDVLDAAKASPGSIGVGVGGLASIPHLVLETLKDRAKVDMSVVPFGGDPEVTPALLGGHVKAAVILPLSVAEHAQAGKVRVLGTFDVQRHPLFPSVPTFSERGYDVTLTAYTFAFAPRGTPEYAIQALHEAFKKAINTEGFKQFADRVGLVVDYAGPADLRRQLESDWASYGQLIRVLKLK